MHKGRHLHRHWKRLKILPRFHFRSKINHPLLEKTILQLRHPRRRLDSQNPLWPWQLTPSSKPSNYLSRRTCCYFHWPRSTLGGDSVSILACIPHRLVPRWSLKTPRGWSAWSVFSLELEKLRVERFSGFWGPKLLRRVGKFIYWYNVHSLILCYWIICRS